MAAQVQVFEVFKEHGNLNPNFFIRVKGRVDDWVTGCAKPHSGPIPAGRPIFDVDTEAADREAAEAARLRNQPVDRVAYTNSELLEIMQWTPDEYQLARDRFGLPDHDAVRETFRGEEVAVDKTRKRRVIDQWVTDRRQDITLLEQLVGRMSRRR